VESNGDGSNHEDEDDGNAEGKMVGVDMDWWDCKNDDDIDGEDNESSR
jgi:hypothetical protein